MNIHAKAVMVLKAIHCLKTELIEHLKLSTSLNESTNSVVVVDVFFFIWFAFFHVCSGIELVSFS